MFLWMSGFQNPLIHTDFDMFVNTGGWRGEVKKFHEVPSDEHLISVAGRRGYGQAFYCVLNSIQEKT